MRIRVLALASVLALSVASAALAAEKGLVANSGGIIKTEPKPKGKKVDKLKQGTMVDVVDHSPDGLWVKVAVTGPDGSQEGWVEKSYVRAISRYGFSWERKDKSGGNQTVGKPKTAEPAATPEPGWGTGEPTPSEGGWTNPGSPEPTAEGWGNEGAATPAPAQSATPEATPAADDGWGDSGEVDLTK